MTINNFSDDYEIKEELGRGAFSVVKKAIKILTGESFAVKVIESDKVAPKDLAKLEREVKIVRALKHPNIVQLFEVYCERKFHYFVFELITGGELFEDIVSRPNYSEQDASYIIQQILESIAYCHSQNVIHRDIKPENLLLSSKEKNAAIKLVDFGLAVECPVNQDIYFGFAGTPGYMAPELIRRVPYGKKVDVWACGVILYVLLVGYCPFWDDDNNKLYAMIRDIPVSFPGQEWSNVSEEARLLITRMMDRNPKTRISADDALKDLWITNRIRVAKNINRQETLMVLKKFNAGRKLKGAIISTIISNKLSRAALILSKNGGQEPSADTKLNLSPGLKENKEMMVNSISEEIIQVTDQFLHCCISLDLNKLKEMCDPNVSMFDSSFKGAHFNCLSLLKFACENTKPRASSITMMHPQVITLSPESACISFIRFTQYSDGINQFLNQSEETMVWQKKKSVWLLVHRHRTSSSPSEQQPLQFNL